MPLKINIIRDIKGSPYEFSGYLSGFPTAQEAEILGASMDEDVDLKVIVEVNVEFDGSDPRPEIASVYTLDLKDISSALSPIAIQTTEFELSRDWSLINAWKEDRILAEADSLYDSIREDE